MIIKAPDRPETSISAARRLISGHLGVRVNLSPEQKKMEQDQINSYRGLRNSILLMISFFFFFKKKTKSKKK